MVIKKGKKLLAILSTVLFLFTLSCKKEDVNPFTISVTPELLIFSTNPGSLIEFTLSGESESPLQKLVVLSKRDNQATVTVVDSVLSGQKSIIYRYELLTPQSADDYSLLLTFQLFNQDGEMVAASRQVDVAVNNEPLTEYSGLTMYSKNSTKTDAYDLIELSALFSDLAVSDIKDIQVASDSDATASLCRAWISPAGGKFVSFNGFDYVNANKVSLENAYLSGAKLDKITNIQENDIILTSMQRADSVVYTAIKIVYVIDDALSENDRYIFTLKR